MQLLVASPVHPSTTELCLCGARGVGHQLQHDWRISISILGSTNGLADDDVRLVKIQFTWRKESKILRDFLSIKAGVTYWHKCFGCSE